MRVRDQLGLHASPREDSATSASEAVYGSVLTLPGQFLEVQDPATNLYEGPYKVLARSLKTFQLQVGKRVEVVSVQRLKPAFTADDEAPVEPPRLELLKHGIFRNVK